MKLPLSPKTQKMAALPLAALLVAGTFFFLHRLSKQDSASSPVAEENPRAEAASSGVGATSSEGSALSSGPSAGVTSSGERSNEQNARGTSKNVQPSATVANEATPESAKPSCWKAEYRIEALQPAQKATFGERDQVLSVAALSELFPKWTESRLCLRTQGRAIAYERDTRNGNKIRIRAGSGRISPQSRIEASYCAAGAHCAPCLIEKDAVSASLFGESAEDAAENEDADISGQLSEEVKRELARLDRENAPAPIEAWAVATSSTQCSDHPRVAHAGRSR